MNAYMKEDAWQYPRENLAARTFNVLVEGPAKALTLFAPRPDGILHCSWTWG